MTETSGPRESSGLSNWLIILVLVAIAAVLTVRAMRPSGAPAPPFPLPPLEVAGWLNTDEPLSTEALRGQVVLVDCWASWCAPCLKELPELVEFYEQFAPEGLVVVGLTNESGQEVANVRQVVDNVDGMDWPIGYGAGMPMSMMGVEALPTFVLFDRSGQSVWVGHTLRGLDDKVTAALAAGEQVAMTNEE